MKTYKSIKACAQKLTKDQKEIIVGSLLGDGYLVRTTCGFAFRANHSFKQKAYVDWKYKKLKNLTNSKPCIYKASYYFRTVSHFWFKNIQKMFYVKNHKILPDIISQWMTPLTLSVWIMDDGSRDGRQLRFNTQSFSKQENKKLIDILEAKLGITATLNRDKNLFRLCVSADSMPRVRHMTAPFIISSMRYKLFP